MSSQSETEPGLRPSIETVVITISRQDADLLVQILEITPANRFSESHKVITKFIAEVRKLIE